MTSPTDNVIIQPGDVMFVYGDSFIDKSIQTVTDGATHVALFTSPTTVIDALSGVLIDERPLSNYTSEVHLEVWEDPTLTSEDRMKLVEYAKTFKGTPYDIFLIPLELLHFELHVPIAWYHEHKHLICSSFMETSAEGIGKKWTNKKNPAPVDLQVFGALRKKGDIK